MPQLGEMVSELRARRIVQVALIYLGVAWGLAEATGFAIDNYDLSRKLLDVVVLLLILGFPAALLLGWNHGEKSQQKATRSEIMTLTTLFVLACIGTYRISTAEEPLRPGEPNALGATFDLGEGSVAVLPFANNTGVDSLDWLGPGLSDLLTSNLAQMPELNVVSPQRLFDLLREAGREETERIPDQFAMEIASQSGARIMARGSILGSAENLAIDVQLIDLTDGTVLGAERARGSDVFSLADSLATKLSGRMLGQLAGTERPAKSPMELTGNLESYRQYQADLRDRWMSLDSSDIQGRYRLAAMYDMMPGRGEEQRKVLEEIVRLDSASAPAFYSLAELAIRQGDNAAADALIEQYRSLVPEELESKRLLGQLYEQAGKYETARQFYFSALRGSEEMAELLDLLVRTYLRENAPARARDELGPYLDSEDADVAIQARILLGDTFAWEGQFDAALSEYEGAETLASTYGISSGRSSALESSLDLRELRQAERPAIFNRSLWRLLEMDRGERALDLVEAAEELHMRGVSRLVPVDYHVLRYARGRALESMGYGDLAGRSYREVMAHWGAAVAEIPLMQDLPLRMEALRAEGREGSPQDR
jgi:TolB-like protein/tetratricopeptide (TPR) repeat protein